MKITVFSFVFLGLFIVGCASAPQGYTPVDPKAKNYAAALASADKKCQIDADCAAVNKGCCLCHGKEVVNQSAALALKPFWNKECAKAVCTLQMCYTDIETWCERGECKSRAKVHPNYLMK